MKAIFLFVAAFICTGAFAQTKAIYGYFSRSDGSKIYGTSTRRGFEKQIIVASYTGGSDNSATIEIEVPTSSYVADFRNIMNASIQPAPTVSKPIAKQTTVKVPSSTLANSTVKTQLDKTDLIVKATPVPAISKVVITFTQYDAGTSDRITRIIVLEDVKVQTVTDEGVNGTSKIKLIGNRIGWAYYSVPTAPYSPAQPVPTANVTKSGWNVIANCSWTNF